MAHIRAAARAQEQRESNHCNQLALFRAHDHTSPCRRNLMKMVKNTDDLAEFSANANDEQA
jgi:hypothetical protein